VIAKRVPMRVTKKSDFAGLVKYITDTQAKGERVGYVTVTNCHQADARDAALEIQAIQALNKRAESDKTYHLIISFGAGENPAPEVLKAIETRICEGLGYREHQRVSVVHHDTDNLHIHIAINKIHPTRLTIHEPYNDHKTLGQLCDKLEGEYGLQRDNHQAQKRGAENRAADMERHTGIETLLGWIKRECLEQIQSAKTWKELHQVMRTNGLEIRVVVTLVMLSSENPCKEVYLSMCYIAVSVSQHYQGYHYRNSGAWQWSGYHRPGRHDGQGQFRCPRLIKEQA
jgi:hypothetical protein